MCGDDDGSGANGDSSNDDVRNLGTKCECMMMVIKP